MKKIYIIAGEPSGDFIGSGIIKTLKKENKNIETIGIGGNLMGKAGFKSLFDIKEISVGGIVEIIPHLFKIKKLIKNTALDIIKNNPKVILTIDSPGFCFRVIKIVKKLAPHIKRVHLVAPSVWAWRPKRSKKVAKLYDKLLTLFDFEPKYFMQHGLDTEFVGHPIIEKFEMSSKEKEDILLIMPGSRSQEIKSLLPIFLKASEKIDAKRLIIPTIPHLVELIKTISKNKKIEIITDEDEKIELYKKAKLAIVSSGTATLELAISGCPMIVCYKLSNITYSIIKRLIKTKYISLVNIILKKEVVPELIQNKCTPDLIFEAYKKINPLLQIENFKLLRERITSNNQIPSKLISDSLLNIVNKQ